MSLLDRIIGARSLAEDGQTDDRLTGIGRWLREKRESRLPSAEKLPQLTNAAISKRIPMFVDGSPSSDDHKCGGCKFLVPGPREATCSIVHTTVDKSRGVCAYWAGGTPQKPSDIHVRQMSADEAQYLEVPAGMKVNCASCKFYRNTDGVDLCALWHGKVHGYDCCMAWSSRAAKMPG